MQAWSPPFEQRVSRCADKLACAREAHGHVIAVPPAGTMKPRPFIALRSMRAQPQDIRICKLRQAAECPIWVAGSTDRRNTFGELLGWGLIEQGLSRACGLQGR
jgi:hypothetical protein